MIQTEFPFSLRHGYIDDEGGHHVDGLMRLATAGDELLPLKDPRVRQNEAYAAVIILSRVVVQLGDIDMITPRVIEGLFASDFAQLNEMYDTINSPEPNVSMTACPGCGKEFAVEAGLVPEMS